MAALWSLIAFPLTFRVAEPAARARHLRLCSSANAVTGQGLGGRSEATGAGNPVLYAVGIWRRVVTLRADRPAGTPPDDPHAHHKEQYPPEIPSLPSD